MSRPERERNQRVRACRADGWTLGRLARHFKRNRTTIRRILDAMGGDPLAQEVRDLAVASQAQLERERARIEDRIRSDRRRLRLVIEELEVRNTDRLVGLAG